MTDRVVAPGTPLRVLLIEDSDDDATLIAAELQAAGFDAQWQRVDSADQLASALQDTWDVVLCDHELPDFSSLQALGTALQHDVDAPFIIVSGRIGEEAVAAALREGAADYVNKDDLSQLGLAVRRALGHAQAGRRERELQHALRHSQAQLAEAQRVGQIGSWEWDATSDRISWSAEMYRIYGLDPDTFQASFEAFLGCLHEDDRDRVEDIIQTAYRSGGALDYEHRIVRPDGEVRTLQGRGTVVLGDDGALIRMFGTGQDITERKEGERRTHETQARLQALLDYAPFPISMRDLDGRFQLINRVAAELTGQPMEVLMSLAPEQLHDLQAATTIDEHERPVREGGGAISFELNLTDRRGQNRYYFVTKYPVTNADGAVIAVGGISIEITERKQAEERLKAAEERFRNAFENAPIGMALVDLDGTWMRVNKAVSDITGYTAEQLLRKTFQDITHPDDLDSDLEYVRQLVAGDIPGYQMEKRYFNARGHVVWVNLSVSLLRDPAGEPMYFIAQMQDISDRKRLEGVKDEFTSIVSHELRTPLTSIRGSLGLLESGVLGELPAQGQRMVEIAVQNTDRLVRLINDILDIERINSGQIDMNPGPCDARELIDRASDAVAALAAAANVSVLIDADPVHFCADGDRVIQTLTNLISNAVKFSPPDSSVRVSCSRRDAEVLFEVSDEGRGIPAENLDSIFGRFAQVDASDSREKGGTGLGLAICRSIVDQHGGRIWAHSVPGHGATFSFLLPAPSDDVAGRQPVGLTGPREQSTPSA